jgi:addiction module HigA family antidote
MRKHADRCENVANEITATKNPIPPSRRNDPGMSVNKLALGIARPRYANDGNRSRPAGITADTALRLARHFNTTPKFWLNLQVSYDLVIASDARAEEIRRTVHPRQAA